LYFLHPRFRRRALWLVILPLCGVVACSGDAADSSVRTDQPGGGSARVGGDAQRLVAPADTDDFGVPLPTDASFAERVVSLNPTATEVIFAIGAESRLVGRSHWDEHPEAAQRIDAVGDGIRPNVETVLQKRPTLVILYASAENRAAAEAFTRAGIRTIALRVDHIAQFASLTRRLGVALGASARAEGVVDSVQRTLDAVRAITRGATVRTVAWPLWQQPVMVVGRGSYLDELLEIAGGRNVFHDLESPSPVVNVEEIARRNPDVLVATAKTRAELEAKPSWRAVRAVREARWIVDQPDVTGRPSVVLGMAAVSLARALHPELAARLPSLLPSPRPAPPAGVP
jgi:iron complex transport system substrate-binding protein